jgi:hypothetical protein
MRTSRRQSRENGGTSQGASAYVLSCKRACVWDEVRGKATRFGLASRRWTCTRACRRLGHSGDSARRARDDGRLGTMVDCSVEKNRKRVAVARWSHMCNEKPPKPALTPTKCSTESFKGTLRWQKHASSELSSARRKNNDSKVHEDLGEHVENGKAHILRPKAAASVKTRMARRCSAAQHAGMHVRVGERIGLLWRNNTGDALGDQRRGLGLSE